MKKGNKYCFTLSYGRDIIAEVESQNATRLVLLYPCIVIHDEIWEDVDGRGQETFLGEELYLWDAAPTSLDHRMVILKSHVCCVAELTTPRLIRLYEDEVNKIVDDCFIDPETDAVITFSPKKLKATDKITSRNESVVEVDFSKKPDRPLS